MSNHCEKIHKLENDTDNYYQLDIVRYLSN